MKKNLSQFKSSLCLAIIGLIIFSFASCDISKEAVTAAKFQETAESLGLTVEDTTEQYEEYGFLQSCTTAGSISGENVDWTADFMVLDSDANAQNAFLSNRANFESTSGNTNVEMNGTNYESYSKTSNTSYMYVCRVDNTLIYINVASEYKESAKALADAIGY